MSFSDRGPDEYVVELEESVRQLETALREIQAEANQHTTDADESSIILLRGAWRWVARKAEEALREK